MPDVVFLSMGDWANVGSHLAESLRRVGVSAKSWAQWHLRMDYPIKSSIYEEGWEQIKEDVEKAKVVWMMHGQVFKQRANYTKEGQMICIYHGGPPLLQMGGERSTVAKKGFGNRYLARGWNPVHFIQHPRMYDNCDYLEKKYLLSPPVNTERLQPKYYDGENKAALGHFPRNTGTGLKTKGHDKVVNIMEAYSGEFLFYVDTQFINWNLHIGRVSSCDVYIEKLSVVLREWGMTALEAAALGKIVIGQFDNRETYEKYYGPSPIITANTEQELREVLYDLAAWSPEKIVLHQKKTREWVEKYHSFEVVGQRLKKILIEEGAKLG